jgi:predicted 2-oxoglutarate/Fe(II)-dependent dioxygenase YbiX/peroxiredoxin
MPTTSLLRPGDPAPWFKAASSNNASFAFDTVAGRYIVLCFMGSSAAPAAWAAMNEVITHRELFDDEKICFFGVTADPRDRDEGRLQQMLPGIRFFWDTDLAVAKAFGAVDGSAVSRSPLSYRGHWLILDPALRVVAMIPFDEQGRHAGLAMSILERLPDVDAHARTPLWAPVLVIPRIFEPDFCKRLIAYYESQGGRDSGFMRDVGGKTVGIVDYSHKRRSDCSIEDEELKRAARERVERRLVPEIRKCFQFHVTRMERYIVCCYEAETGGHFNAHRDDTTFGTAHRRFAVTINLDAEGYEGGDLAFPEFGTRRYRAPTGGAVVFSCSLLHKVWPVTKGKRYAFLPFLYDEAAARLRERNNARLGENVGAYRSGTEPTATAAE